MQSRAVLITGASTGIGFASAEKLAREGWLVFAGARKKEDFDRLGKVSPKIKPVALDVTDETSILATLELVETALAGERIEGLSLVNNAGIAVVGPVEGVALEDWRRQFDVNVFGLVRVTQVFLPLIRAGKGRIVNLSSVSGIVASPFFAPYSASKFAVEAISDALRRELAGTGVDVIVLEPGPIKTPIWEKGLAAKQALKEKLPPQARALYGDRLDRLEKMIESLVHGAIDVSEVTDVLHEVLTQPAPPLRRLIASMPSHVQTRLTQVLPARWVDFAIRKVL